MIVSSIFGICASIHNHGLNLLAVMYIGQLIFGMSALLGCQYGKKN